MPENTVKLTINGKEVAAPRGMNLIEAAKLADIEVPSSGKDGTCFWIRQMLPPEKTFPNGFAFVLAGRLVGAESALETVDDQTGLGTPPYLNPRQQEQFDRKEGNWGSLPNYEEVRKAPGSAATLAR